MKRLLIVLVAALVLLTVITVGFAAMYFQQTTEVKKLQTEQENTDEEVTDTVDETEVTQIPEETSITYTDVGMGVNITYGSSWTLSSNTVVTEGTTDDGGIGSPVITDYEVNFVKDTYSIEFTKILGGVGGLEFGLDPAMYSYTILPNPIANIVRYATIGDDNWFYVHEVDCVNVPAEMLNNGTVCVDPFFPGFGDTNWASVVRANNISDSAILTEIDEIVLSAVNL